MRGGVDGLGVIGLGGGMGFESEWDSGLDDGVQDRMVFTSGWCSGSVG